MACALTDEGSRPPLGRATPEHEGREGHAYLCFGPGQRKRPSALWGHRPIHVAQFYYFGVVGVVVDLAVVVIRARRLPSFHRVDRLVHRICGGCAHPYLQVPSYLVWLNASIVLVGCRLGFVGAGAVVVLTHWRKVNIQARDAESNLH